MKKDEKSKDKKGKAESASKDASVTTSLGAGSESGTTRLVAVIDIGTTAIRMKVAEVKDGAIVQQLDELSHPTQIGKDTFTKGRVRRNTMEHCVDVLNRYKAKLAEYGLQSLGDVRAVATTGVREASNRDAFLDRIYVATGIPVTVIEESEATRHIYLSLRPLFDEKRWKSERPAIVVEVGAGVTEILVLEGARVTFSQTYRLGSQRIRALIVDSENEASARRILETQIEHVLDGVMRQFPKLQNPRYIVIGPAVQFAMGQLEKSFDETGMVSVSTKKLASFVDDIFGYTVEKLVKKYRISFPAAESLIPSLLILQKIGSRFGASKVFAVEASIAEGVLADLAQGGKWDPFFVEQIEHSAMELGAKYQFDPKHARYVADFCDQFFEVLRPLHGLGDREKVLLRIAAITHEIGRFVATSSHHKHSMYLIANSELFGLSSRETILVAVIARYHRRALPKRDHELYSGLDLERRVMVRKLAAILRAADALDRSYNQRIKSAIFRVEKRRLHIDVRGVSDLSLERLAMQTKGNLLAQVYGLDTVLTKV